MVSSHYGSNSGLRERKKERTRQDLLRAAVELFDEKGYENTTVDDIVDRAEYSRSTFFRYFGSKEDVVIGKNLELLDEFEQYLQDHENDPADDDFKVVKSILSSQWLELTANAPELEAACVRLWTSEPSLMASYLRVNMAAELALGRFLSRERTGHGAEVDVEGNAMAIALLGVLRSLIAGLSTKALRDNASVGDALERGFAMFERCWPPAVSPRRPRRRARGHPG
jgi:AcrR family transcriptional regulator